MDEMVPVYLVWIKAGSEVCQQVFEKPAVKAFFADEYGNSMAIAVLFAVFGSVIIRHFETTPFPLRINLI